MAIEQPAIARTWTDTQGRKVEAEFVGIQDGRVQLKTQAGQIQSVPVEQLSSEDRRFVANAIGVKRTGNGATEEKAPAAPADAGDANDRFSEAIRQNPNSADAYYQRGLSRLNRGQAKESLADFDQAVKLDPKSAQAYDGRGQAHAAGGNPVAAAADFDRAIGLNPNLATAYKHRADNLKALGNSEEGKELLDKKIEDYRKMYQAARDKQLDSKAWQPLNSTSGPTTRSGMIGQMAKLDYDKAKEIEGRYRPGTSSGGGSGYGSGTGAGKPPAVAQQPPKTPPPQGEKPEPSPPSPSESESGVVVIPEKVAQGDNVVLIADPDKLAAGVAHEVPANSGKKQGSPSAAYSKDAQSSSAAAKNGAMKLPKGPKVEEVDFYRDADNDGKLDQDKDELLASDADSQDGFSAEVSTANFPVGQQKYFAVPKVAPETAASGMQGADAKMPAAKASSSDKKYAAKKPAKAENAGGDDSQLEQEPQPPVPLTSAAVSGSGEVAAMEKDPEQVASAESPEPKTPSKAPASAGGEGPSPGKGGGGYAGPRNPDAARAVERALGYAGRNEYGPAIREYDDLLTEYVDEPYYLSGRAGVHLAQGGYDLAIRDYNRLIEVENPTAEIYYNRGCAHLSVGNLAAAIADFDASLKLDELGKFANLALNNRGTAYARSGDFVKAAADFEAAIKLNPNDGVAYRNRSLALRKLGRTTEADADLAKSQQLGAGA